MTDRKLLHLGLELLAAEGPRAVYERWIDRRLDAARRSSFPPLQPGVVTGFFSQPPPVLNVMAEPPLRRLGGVAHQFLARYAEESRVRPFALLYPEQRDGRTTFRLELTAGRDRGAVALAGATPADGGDGGDGGDGKPALATAIAEAARLVGTRTVHVDGIAGIALESLNAVVDQELRLILSLHDFALRCPRPHLLVAPHLRCVDDAGDPERCESCLGGPAADRSGAAGITHVEHTTLAAELVGRCAALVFPSEFLRRRHQAWLRGPWPRADVIPPIGLAQTPARRRIAPAGPPRRVAFVGSVQPHKGSAIFEEVVDLAARLPDPPDWFVFGGGDRATLRRLRRRPRVTVEGYYRAGSLPQRLRAARIDAALLLSVVPEAHGLTFDECALAGVPLIAFDHGAIADRVRIGGGGGLVPPAAGAAGVLAELARRPSAAPPTVPTTAPVPALLALYRESS